MIRRLATALIIVLPIAGCSRLENVGKAPTFTPTEGSNAYYAMSSASFPKETGHKIASDQASLWRGGRGSLLGDQRAEKRGDILTVVIKINDSAQISNSTARKRSGSESLAIPQFLGLPQKLDAQLPPGASSANAVSTKSTSNSAGDGSVRRNEKLTLRVAATVTDVLQNGVLRIEGSQEVRVNFEMRELLVTGYIRPADISRQNEITYDKIASARISYGGRGQITDMQQPRYGQQISDILLPF